MPGEMAEWSIAAVLKTVVLRGTGGSNPSLSAASGNSATRILRVFFFDKRSLVNVFTDGRFSNKISIGSADTAISVYKTRSKGKGDHTGANPSAFKYRLWMRLILFYTTSLAAKKTSTCGLCPSVAAGLHIQTQ